MNPLVFLLSSGLAVAPPLALGPPERAYFGQQLAKVVTEAESELAAKGVRCTLGPPLSGPAPLEGDPASWVSEQAGAVNGTLRPRAWQVMLACMVEGKADFRMAVSLSASPALVPLAKLVAQGPGYVIRDVGGDTRVYLVGKVSIIDPKVPFKVPPPPRDGPPLAVAIQAGIAAEEGPGRPAALEVLKKLDASALSAALQSAAAIAPPKTTLAPPASPALPAEVPYVAAHEPEPRSTLFGQDHGPSKLTRVLAPDEAGYFQTVLARSVRAGIQSLSKAGRTCASVPDRDADLTTAELTPDGFAPRGWMFTLSCVEKGAKPIVVSVELGGHLRPEGKGAKVLAQHSLGPSARFEKIAYSTPVGLEQSRLRLGAPMPANRAPSIVPGLMRLGAMELVVQGFKLETDAADVLLRGADLKPLLELLAHPPGPPHARSVVREGKPGTVDRAATEAEVYRYVLEQVGGERAVVAADTLVAPLPPDFAALAAIAAPDLLPSAVADFEKLASRSAPFPASFTWRAPVARLSSAERKALFSLEPGAADGWQAFREKYPGAHGLCVLSRVGLSSDGTQAIVAVDRSSDWLAGSGETWFLLKTETGWKTIYRIQRWIS